MIWRRADHQCFETGQEQCPGFGTVSKTWNAFCQFLHMACKVRWPGRVDDFRNEIDSQRMSSLEVDVCQDEHAECLLKEGASRSSQRREMAEEDYVDRNLCITIAYPTISISECYYRYERKLKARIIRINNGREYTRCKLMAWVESIDISSSISSPILEHAHMPWRAMGKPQ
jgi:hypothetical protein